MRLFQKRTACGHCEWPLRALLKPTRENPLVTAQCHHCGRVNVQRYVPQLTPLTKFL